MSDAFLDDLMARVDQGGLALTGEGGFLPELVKAVLERGLAAELTDHLGYERGDPAAPAYPNFRNGATPKTVETAVGQVGVDTPRDRAGTFDPHHPMAHRRRRRQPAKPGQPRHLRRRTAHLSRRAVHRFQRLTDKGERSTLMVRDIATGKETAFPAAGKLAIHPQWSLDGPWVQGVSGSSTTWETPQNAATRWRRSPPTAPGEPVVLFRGTASRAGFKPVYSPDGTRILFGCLGVGGPDDDASIMNADGSDVEVLVGKPGQSENHFRWGPSAD